MVSYVDDGSKMVLCGRTTPHPLSSAQRNQQWPFMHCVWVLNRVTLTWAHLNIIYLCNELELELFWTDGTNYCLSYFELDRSSSRSTLCQKVDRRSLVPVLFTIDLCQWFFSPFLFPLQFLFPPAVLLQLMLTVCSLPAKASDLIAPNKSALLLTNSYYSTAVSH